MAKITIIGNAVVVTSALALEDIKFVEKYRPEALVLYGGDDGKEPVFRIGTGASSINKYGAEFESATHDDAKLAVLTLQFVADADIAEDELKGLVCDTIGGSLASLNKLEASLPEVIAEIKAERTAIMDSIAVQ